MYDVWSNYQDEYDIKRISGLYQSAMLNKIEPDVTHMILMHFRLIVVNWYNSYKKIPYHT